jgi:hypothetical protein
MEKLGILAGAGDLPVLLAQSALRHGRLPVVIQMTQSPPERFAGVAAEVYSAGIGQVQKITRRLLDSGVRELAIIGKIEKNVLLNVFRVDLTAIKILASTRNKGVPAIIAAVMNHFESKGVKIIEQHRFLSHLMPNAGVLTKTRPNESQWADVKYGVQLARRMANLHIGQTVVVKEQIPIAIEAVEGTDETIRRGGVLGGKGIVVAKAAAEDHDFRIDTPTIGEGTLKTLHEAAGSVLAVEAGRTFVLNQESLCEQADRWKIAIVAVDASQSSMPPEANLE